MSIPCVFKSPHRMMPGVGGESGHIVLIIQCFDYCSQKERGYVHTCVRMYVRLYECVYVRTYVILLDSS